MSNPNYTELEYAIGAGEHVTIARQANFVVCLSATTDFKIAFGNAPETEFAQGLSFNSDVTMDTVRLYNHHAQDLVVRLGMGRGGVADNRVQITSALEVINSAGTRLTTQRPEASSTSGRVTIGAAVSTKILEANPDRKRVLIGFSAAAAQVHVVTDGAAVWTAGPRIEYPKLLDLTHQGEVWVGSDTGTDIWWAEESFD